MTKGGCVGCRQQGKNESLTPQYRTRVPPMAADRREGAQSPLQPQKNDLKLETSSGAQRALRLPPAR
ncbi:Protein Piccolo [Manis pentadactyla]|nr:Protein Piccolo [Manis pentadactyla]